MIVAPGQSGYQCNHHILVPPFHIGHLLATQLLIPAASFIILAAPLFILPPFFPPSFFLSFFLLASGF